MLSPKSACPLFGGSNVLLEVEFIIIFIDHVIMTRMQVIDGPTNMKFEAFLVCLTILSSSLAQNQPGIPLTFQLQASLTGTPDLSGLVPGIDVALDIINENSSILNRYRLHYNEPVDAQVSTTVNCY